MSSAYSSSNPFRQIDPTESRSMSNHHAHQQAYLQPRPIASGLKKQDVLEETNPQPLSQESGSTAGRENDPFAPGYPFDGKARDHVEEQDKRKTVKVPWNPFENSFQTTKDQEWGELIAHQNASSSGKAPMDVNAFKRLLMTGSSGLELSLSPVSTQPPVAHDILEDGASIHFTDVSSMSRRSTSEATQNPHLEPSSVPQETLVADEYRRWIRTGMTPARKKPPPPNSRHGTLIKVELRDEPPTAPLCSSPLSTSNNAQNKSQIFDSKQLQADLNKPLPAAPVQANRELERKFLVDREATGKVPSPSELIRTKRPPTLSLATRQSLLYDLKSTPSDPACFSSQINEGTSTSVSPSSPTIQQASSHESFYPLSRSNSARAPPPPPPPRRSGSARAPNQPSLFSPSLLNNPLDLPSLTLPPQPPPARGSSQSLSGGKPPSLRSVDLIFPPSSGKRERASAPPPPPRTGRRITGQEVSSQRREESLCETSENTTEERDSRFSHRSDQEILADLSRLQREIDDLRRSETGIGGVT